MSNKKQTGIPRRATSGPGLISTVLFIVIVILWVPHTLSFFTGMASVQGLLAILLAPLAIVGLFLAYNSGISLAKYNYSWVVNGNLSRPFGILGTMHIACIVGCLFREVLLVGYPFKMCFDTCQQVSIIIAIAAYTIVTFIFFLPAYYGVQQYRIWVKTYNLPAPSSRK